MLNPPLAKPKLRGRFHQFAFLAAIPATVILVVAARSVGARVVVALYGLSLIAMFGTSGAYHRLRWTPRAEARMRRLDHCMIYVLIAGTYTPFSLLVLKRPWSVVLLSLVLGGAVVGVAIKIFAIDRLSVLGYVLYVVLGWLLVLAAPQMVHRLRMSELVPLVAGGLLYTAGAIVLAVRKPDPAPRVFGYHEVFHLSTVLAAACHYAAVLQVVVLVR